MITNPNVLLLHQSTYPDPRHNFPRFNLGSLRDPPPGFRLFGETADEINLTRRFNREELDVLAKFHLYGINANLTSRATNIRIIRALVKLHYYMDHVHQAHSWEEMCDPRRDAGPRLLSCSVASANLIPYSRHFPIPPLTYAPVAPGFNRPFYCAPSDRVPDSYVEFMLLVSNGPDSPAANIAAGQQPPPRLPPPVPAPDTAPVTSRTRSKVRPLAPAPSPAPSQAPSLDPMPPPCSPPPAPPRSLPPPRPQTAALSPAPAPTQAPAPAPAPAPAVVLPPISELISGQQPIFQAPAAPEPTTRVVPESKQKPVPESAPEPMQEDPMNDAMDFTMDPLPEVDMPSPPPETQSGNFVRPPAARPHEIVEAIERAVMSFAYADLERDPSAPSKSPRPHLQAGSLDELQRCIVTSTSATARVNITDSPGVGEMQIDPNGFSYPFRGRGPVWRGNSCAVDAAIMVGRLLDAGSTVYDRKENGWQSRLSRTEKAFVEVTNANWDVLSNDDSANLRDKFWGILAEANPAIQIGGAFNSAWAVWSSVASNIAQFQFSYVEALCQCPCRGGDTTNSHYQASFVAPPVYEQDQHGVSIEEVVARPFASVQLSDCRTCHGTSSQTTGLTATVVRERRMHNLPLRMVLSLDERIKVKNHTQDFSLEYCDINGQPQKATYRWLGGVYFHENHFRVFWTDEQRGEARAGEIMQYDGQQNSGLMLGGITPHHPECRVPPVFWKDKPIPLLVYERVLNPEPDVLNTALSSLYSMVDLQLKNEPILHNHVPWRPAAPAYNGLHPWEPILACDNHNVHTDNNPLSSELFTTNKPADPDVTIIDPPFPAFPTETPQTQPSSPPRPGLSSPRLESAQPFTTDPKAVLHCAPASLPISMPLHYMDQPGPRNIVNYADYVNSGNANDNSRSTSTPGGGPQGPYFFVPSPPHSKTPSPPLSSLPWEQWIKSPTPSPGKIVSKNPSSRRSKSSSKGSRSSSANGSPSRVTKRKGKKREEDPTYSPRRSTRASIAGSANQLDAVD